MLEANLSLNKIGESISHTLGNPYDHFLIEKIKFSAIQFRATLLRRDLERNTITKSFLQHIPCLELECVDLAECCDVPSYRKVLRTKEEIPTPLRTKDQDSFYRVASKDLGIVFTEINLEDFTYRQHLKYTSKVPVYAFERKRIIILNQPTKNFNNIEILSVFEDPRQVGSISNCKGNVCYSDDDAFPMGADQYEAMERYLLNVYGQSKVVDNEEVTLNNNQS